MMGHKEPLKKGYEYDLIYAKKHYCYLQNNNKQVRFIKRSMRKRLRNNQNHETINQLLDYQI